MSRRKLPINWPSDFEYSGRSVVHGVHPNLFFQMLAVDDPQAMEQREVCIEKGRVHPHIRIQHLAAPHPLANQRGVFATKRIPKDTVLGEYVGEMGCYAPEDSFRQGAYGWSFKRYGCSMTIYSGKIANEITFVNDFRGLKESPNTCHAWVIHRGMYYFVYKTTCEIQAQEEVLVDYGKEWDSYIRKLCHELI